MKKSLLLVLLLSPSFLLTACQNSKTESNATSTTQTTKSSTSSVDDSTDLLGKYSDTDLNADYDESNATKIKLGNSVDINGEGATADGQIVTISKGGTYIVDGELSDGQLIINCDKTEKVQLVLNNATIHNNDGPAILVEQTDKAIITLAKNSKNTVSDGENYTLNDGETEPDATIFSKDDLTINGEGSLNVKASYNNGIRSKDDLTLVSGSYTIDAKNNALKGKDSVSIKDGTYKLTTSEGDGIQANNSTEENKGFIAIDGGEFTIKSGRDGIQAETALSIQKASINIKTSGGYNTEQFDTNESYKGLKAKSVTLLSGTYSLNTLDDGIHSNDTLTIKGGDYTIDTGDDGIHADNSLTVDNGNISINHSYEGIESSVIKLNGGTINVTASDDGINAGGSSEDDGTGQFGADSFSQGGNPPGQADDSKSLEITGGTITIDASGDGLDSNGSITMSGGEVIVYGPTNGGNGALDYDGTFNLTGGTLIATGTSDMAMNVSDDSSQASVGISFNSTQPADTLYSLTNSDGTPLVTFKSKKEFQHVVISSPDLSNDATYTLLSGGSTSKESSSGLYPTGTKTTGEKLSTIAFDSSNVLNIDQDGNAVQSGMGMGGGMGAPR
ncbi:carbohydrate-binding domain-containing protein [Vagococcus sp. JNUCC 83]